MNRLQTFQVFPKIPEPLFFLETLARNLWWSWNLDAIELFRRIDPRLWQESGHNPILFSTLISQERLKNLSKDESFLAHMRRVQHKFESQILATEESSASGLSGNEVVAYFSMEFGIHESLPLFAGGLGVLSGDHLKAASDLALPLVGVGLLYRRGYFHQYLDPSGWQQEEYPETDLYHLPVRHAKDEQGREIQVQVESPQGTIHAAVWRMDVGRVPLYLLDTNLAQNSTEVREITSRLYAGEQKLRLAQEVLLGIGGMRTLDALGIEPAVVHMNEGHCAFAGLERLSQLMHRHSLDLKTALEIVPRCSVYTTHTPVAAGHDEFPLEMVKPYLQPFEATLGIPVKDVMAFGQTPGTGTESPLSMFVLGIRLAQYCNGVSELHGSVARRMWSHVWPEQPHDEVPITHITNGVHVASWLSLENALLFERYLGPDWYRNTWASDVSDRIDEIYDEELWRSHEMSRSRLIRLCRFLMVKQYRRRNAPKAVMEDAESVLDQEVLTIGFARRFATYKRANLLLHDPDRLEAILTSKTHPVQIIFAGKAHPKDNEGKELIKQLVQFSRRPSVRHRILFLEDYDINVTRHMIQGVDIWLNNPRRPMEACGTSGMKAALNGVLNVSVLDGWWCEGFAEDRGWRIGNGEEYEDHAYQDAVESQALYNILENDVVPTFYDRRNGDAPTRWIKMMKESMKMAMHEFCAQCMVKRYEHNFYIPAVKHFRDLLDREAAAARSLQEQRNRLLRHWKQIRIESPVQDTKGPFRVGDSLQVTAIVTLGELQPDEVEVELYYGSLKHIDALSASHTLPMQVQENRGNGHYLYQCTLPCHIAGRFGFTARVTPNGDDWIKHSPGLVRWA
ncbi:MAG TPA: alpha-glucan family phosphorylase [Desulfobacterales bacterium]